MARTIDPITFEIVRNALYSTAEQMAAVIERTAFSTVIREMLDYSAAVFDARGRILAQSTRTPSHLNSMTPALETILTDHIPPESWRPDDIVILNDPFQGGQHLPDILTFLPIFYEDEMVGFAGVLGHHVDVGGRAPGSYGGDCTEIYQEGLRLPAVKIYEGGKPNQALFDVICANIREPKKTLGDLRAQIQSLRSGEKGYHRLMAKYSKPVILQCMEELILYSERLMRKQIEELPEGVYHGEALIDDDGISDEPIKISVKLTIKGSEITADYSGSSAQRRAPINATMSSTRSATYYFFAGLLGSTIPTNYGLYKPITVIAPEGTIVNARSPAPVVGRMTIYHRIVDALLAALSGAIPDRIMASSYGMSNVIAIGGVNESDGRPWVFFECPTGGWGGRPGIDGLECMSAHVHNIKNVPVEMQEINYPVLIDRFELIQDSGGPGQFRGGMGVRRDIKLLDTFAVISLQSDRFKWGAPGARSGKPGRPGHACIIRKNGVAERLPSKFSGVPMNKGDVFQFESQGGGGYGEAQERDLEAVRRDVKLGKVSHEQASRVYGIEER